MLSRKLAVIFLSVIVLVNTLSTPLILLDFNLRKDYIYKVLCINNEKPITVCGGKCYLSKRLEDTSNTTSQSQESKSRRTTAPELFKCINHFDFNSKLSFNELTLQFYPLECTTLNGVRGRVFQPPKLV